MRKYIITYQFNENETREDEWYGNSEIKVLELFRMWHGNIDVAIRPKEKKEKEDNK